MRRTHASVIFGRVTLILFLATVLVPLLWVYISGFKSGDEILGDPWGLPKSPSLRNFEVAWGSKQYGIAPYFVNTIIACVGTLLILLPVGAMAAYVFAKYPFRGSKLLFTTFLGGMMFPNFLVIVPLYLLLKSIPFMDQPQGLTGTLPGLILVYVAYSLSFTIFVLTGFFQSTPNELAEAAMLDGCGHLATFGKVMLPLVKPGIVVVGIFNAIGLWNEFSLALVLFNQGEKRTLALAIQDMATAQQYQSDWGALFGGLVIVTLPIMLVYLMFKDRIQEAMLAGAIKG